MLDERIPLSHGVIGQETQGPGGFFMALRSIHVMQGILEDVAAACPGTRIFNYTNPVNIVAQAVTDHSDVPFVSLCEGPIVFPEELAEVAGLDPERLDVASVGLNHGSWSVRHRYDGRDLLPLIKEAYARRGEDPALRAPDPPHAAPRGHDGRAAQRVLPVLLLRGRGARRAPVQADDARRGHPLVGAGLLGPLHRAGRARRARARPAPLARRDPRARAGDRLHGRRVQRPRRDAAGQRAQPRHRARLRRLARGRDARPLRRAGRDAAADAGPARAPARAGRGARRVPAGGGRRGLVGRRDATGCARSPRTRSSARSTWPSGSTGSWRMRTRRTCRRASCPRSLSGAPRPWRGRRGGPRPAGPRTPRCRRARSAAAPRRAR